jgi:DNA gyrase subunit A
MVVADPQGYLLTICENGYGKRTPFGANVAGIEAAEEETEEPSSAPSPEEAMGEAENGEEERSAMRYRKQRRGGKGVRDIRTSDRNGSVVGILAVNDTDDVMLITAQGMVNRTHVSEIRIVGRNTQGVRVMNLNEGDKIASLAKVAREEEEEPPTAEEPGNVQPSPEGPPA